MSDSSKTYKIESVLLQSERLNVDVELREVVQDIEIFEHIQKPYLTGFVFLVDNENMFQNADVLGGERVTIAIKSLREDTEVVKKTFYISKVLNTDKINDNIQTVTLHLVEDINFISNALNINRYYSGKSSKILTDIASEFLNKDLIGTQTDKQKMSLIVPNLSPIEAMQWICSRTTNRDGYPFYLYSTFVGNELQFNDLGSMLQTPVINADVTYKYSSKATKSDDPDVKRRTIFAHEFLGATENLYKVIQKGLVGSKYEYIDSINEKHQSFKFDIMKDFLLPALDTGAIQSNQPNFSYSDEYKINGKSLNQLNSKTITQVGGSGAYREVDDGAYPLSYRETVNDAEYKLEIISRAMDNMIKKNPLNMLTDGIDFLDGDRHHTIGNNIRVEFEASKPDRDGGEKAIDVKKSGDYLIFAARHMFKLERYDVALTCIKLGNYKK